MTEQLNWTDFEDYPCLSLRISFRYANAFKVNSVPLSDLWFIFHYSRRWTHKELAAFYVRLCPVYNFLKDFIVSIITFRYLCPLVFILWLVLGCFLTSFSFSWLKESSRCPPKWVFPISIPSIRGGGFPCLHTLCALIVCRVSGNGHSSWCDVILHCSLELHFSNV